MGRAKLSVFLFILCASKCLAMSYNELEDFAEHLKKTSQLSPILKKGVDPDADYDEEEVVSDHAWEDSGKFEGDLILNERQRRLIVEDVAEGISRNGLSDGTKRWPDNEVIYYIQVEHFNSDQVQAIESGIEDIARASCVKFRPYRKGDRDAVVIQGSRRGCFSQVGYQSGYQVLNLSGRHPVGRGCFRHGTVVHELLHTLGFYHMQSSPDRDDYVDIVWPNIVKRARHNFRKYNTFSVTDFGVGYDYDSVLHYSRRAFSSNGQDTIVPKQGGAQIGQRIGLSDKDTQKLNKMYCDADSESVQADENTPKKPPRKKKNGQNKPFEGHGIGYHQGKTVAIKILPAPETYRLPDVPSFHVFDYFSKAPQILSTSENEGFRIGKEIAYSNSPPEPVKEHKIPIDFNTKLENSDHNKNHKQNNIEMALEIRDLNQPNDKQESDIKPSDLTRITHDKPSSYDKTTDPESIDAFDRLEKIIKSHVYPSHTPDLSIYKGNEPYVRVDSYNPPEIKEQNQKLVSPVASNEGALEIKKINSANRFDHDFYDYSSEKPSLKQTNYENSEIYENGPKSSNEEDTEEDAIDNDNKPFIAPSFKFYEDEYVSTLPKSFRDRYMGIYSHSKNSDEKSNKNKNEWYQKYPYYPDETYYNEYTKSGLKEISGYGDENKENVSSSVPIRNHDYSLYRIPDYMTKNWYKINDEFSKYR